MEQRSQAASRVLAGASLCLLSAPLWAAELRYDVRYERALKDHHGVLTIDGQGVAYHQSPSEKQKAKTKPPKLESVRFDYDDIQQLWIAPGKLVLVTYRDRKWFLGVDKEFEFFLPEGQSFEDAYKMLRDRLDQRLVAALADTLPDALWEMPVKLLGTFRGSEGVLQVGPERIVFKTPRERQSRTWRYQDIENVSTSGPFQLTVTTFERAKTHYGSMRGFNFQLKERLDPKRYDLLWKRVNQDKGLHFLTSILERNQTTQ